MAKKKEITRTTEQTIIDKVIKRLKTATDADKHNRDAGIEDMRFVNGDQWSTEEKKRRADKGRPALQINLLPKFVDQVVGDMLHNTPQIKIRPVDSRADINIANIRQGIVSQIEYQSNSKGIYGYGAKQMVTSGYGAWRVLTRYTEENPFIQEIYIEGIRNPFLLYLDPSSKDQNYADAKWGVLLERISKDEFDERYPKAKFTSDSFGDNTGMGDENWYDENSVTVAEYFTVEAEQEEMHQLEDGRVVTQDDFDALIDEWDEKFNKDISLMEKQLELPVPPPTQEAPPQIPPVGAPSLPQAALGAVPPQPPQPPPVQLQQPFDSLEPKPKIVKSRMTDKTVIRHRVLTAAEILEGGEKGDVFPGKYIPLVLLKGKELNIEGKNHVYSLVRNGKDPQKLINYWNSSAAETIALAPKAPYIGTAKQFEGYENDYAASNVDNFAFLKYNPDPEAPGPPLRTSPGAPPTAIFEQIRRGEENLKSVLGMYNIDMGAGSTAQTGAAVTAQQTPGDVGTFEFTENLSRAIMYTGKIINEMIPAIYDTERDVRIRNFDESETFVPVNTNIESAIKSVRDNPERFKGLEADKLRTMFVKDGKDAKFNDITVGKYDVVVTTGPSYATQRQESTQHLLQLVQAMPQQMSVAADIIVENMDFKGADELAGRLRKPMVAQGLTKPRDGEEAPQQQETPPEVLLAQAKLEGEKIKVQSDQIKLQQAQIELQKAQAEVQKAPEGDAKAQANVQIATLKIQLAQAEAQIDHERMMNENAASAYRVQQEQERLKFAQAQQELALTQQRESHEAKMTAQILNIEKTKVELQAKRDPLNIRKKANDIQ